MSTSEFQEEIALSFERIKEKFTCHICGYLLKEPVLTSCLHVFCKFCIPESKHWNCPLCNMRINKRNLKNIDYLNGASLKLLELSSSIQQLTKIPVIIENSSNIAHTDCDNISQPNSPQSEQEDPLGNINNDEDLKDLGIQNEIKIEIKQPKKSSKRNLTKTSNPLIANKILQEEEEILKRKVESEELNTKNASEKEQFPPGAKLKEMYVKLDKLTERDLLLLKSPENKNTPKTKVNEPPEPPPVPLEKQRETICPIFKKGSLTNYSRFHKRVIFHKKGQLCEKITDSDLIECPECHKQFPKKFRVVSEQLSLNESSQKRIDENGLLKIASLSIINEQQQQQQEQQLSDPILDSSQKPNNIENSLKNENKRNSRSLKRKAKNFHFNYKKKQKKLNEIKDNFDSSSNLDNLANNGNSNDSNPTKTNSSNTISIKKLKIQNLSTQDEISENEDSLKKRLRIKTRDEINYTQHSNNKSSKREVEKKISASLGGSTQSSVIPSSVPPPVKRSTRKTQVIPDSETPTSDCTVISPTIEPAKPIQKPLEEKEEDSNVKKDDEVILNSQISDSSEISFPMPNKIESETKEQKQCTTNHSLSNNLEQIDRIQDIIAKNNSNQLVILLNESAETSMSQLLIIETVDIDGQNNDGEEEEEKNGEEAEEIADSQDILEATPQPQLVEKRPKIKELPKIITSGLNEEEKEEINKFIEYFNLSYYNNYEPSVTHLVINNNLVGSTLKFLESLADGKWIVTINWVKKSLECGKILPEELFEAVNPNGESGPTRARIRSSLLFANFEIYLHGEISFIPKDKLKSLLERVGCTIIENPKKFSPQNIRHGLIVVQEKKYSHNECQVLFKRFKRLIVDHFWPIECISDYKLRPIWPHLQMEESLEYLQLGYPQALMEFDMLLSESENPDHSSSSKNK